MRLFLSIQISKVISDIAYEHKRNSFLILKKTIFQHLLMA